MHAEARPATSGYEVELAPLPANDVLRDSWLELQARSEASFFQSWQWIGTWLETVCPTRMARLLRVRHDGRLVAMGVLTRRGRLFGLAPASLRLHETGSRELDSLTIEYNGLLSETGHDRQATTSMMRHLLEHEPRWLTTFLPGIDMDRLSLPALRALSVDIRLRTRPTHYVDLRQLRENGCDYVSCLGPKTRSAIRRTARKFEQTLGQVSLEVARTPAQRLEWFHAMAREHRNYWRGKNGTDGAFRDQRVIRFHERMLEQSTDTAGAQMVRLSAGAVPVGYAYNIVSKATAYFYQSGICYDAASFHGSPGLLLLSRVIQQHLAAGMDRFELMAGDAPYKRSLGTHSGSMAWASIDRRSAATRLRRAWWRFGRLWS